MSLEDIFKGEDLEYKRSAMSSIRRDKTSDAYSLVEGELSGSLQHNALVTLASLNFDRTYPFLKGELAHVPEKYSWLGHPDYRSSPFILTMEVILGEQDDRGKLQAALDTFKPLSEKERAFLEYTLQCLFYNSSERKKEIIL